MKKVIFLLVLIVSSVFGGSDTKTIIKPNSSGSLVSSCSDSVSPPSPRSPLNYNYAAPACIDRGVVYPTDSSKYNTVKCNVTFETVNPHCVVNGNDSFIWFDTKETASGSWVCIQPSGGCPAGQTFNEQTCQCDCAPRPTGYKVDVPLTEENCNITQASLLLSDSGANGLTTYIVDVLWDSCRGVCMGKTAECPCNTALFNGACVDIAPPSGSCPDGSIFKNIGLGVGTGIQCSKVYYSASSGFTCFEAPAGCCTGNTGTNDGDGDGQPDSNTTNPDTNTTNPDSPGEDGGEDGEEDGGETGGGDSNTSTPAPGDSNTSTPAPGDSNTSTPAPGDSNTSAPYEEYEESDADKDGKESISGYLDEAVNTADKIKSDYERLMSAIQNGVAPVSISSGSAPQFCATVFGKQICINLCDSFGYFYTIFYYIFLILLTVMALRIYYTAFKMR